MKASTKRSLGLVAIGLLSVGLWHTPLLYPFKILVVFIHEMCHGAAALLTGGEIVRIAVNPDQSGFTESVGGWFPVIASAGYVGSSAVGALLLFSASRPKLHNAALVGLGLCLGLATVLYVRNPFGMLFGAGGALLLIGAVVHRVRWVDWLVAALAVMCCLYAVYDFSDYLLHDAHRTDAGILARYLGIDALAVPIGIGWSLISLGLLFGAARRSLFSDA